VAVEDGAAVEWSSEVGAADRIVERLHPFASDVGSFVPEGLEAYARVLHPARRVEQGRRIKVRWAGVAPKAATAIHPAVQFEELRPGPEIEPPLEGTLERDELDALIEILARHTGTPRSCWFGIWEGYGWMQGGRAVAELVPRPAHWWSRRRRRRPVEPVAPPGPRVQVPGRSLALHRGPIEAAAAFCRPPTFQSPQPVVARGPCLVRRLRHRPGLHLPRRHPGPGRGGAGRPPAGSRPGQAHRPRAPLTRRYPLASSGRHSRGSGPMYSESGRIRRLSAYCSRMWAVQPAMRAAANRGV
jgi:hypothetical protein